MDLKPPPYPADRFPVDSHLVAKGQAIFARECHNCHGFGGKRTGQVMTVAETGTDTHRAEMWTKESAAAYNAYAEKYPWKFTHFRSTGGYASVPLDGIWTRAPYLHNGSVPTLRDLLEPVDQRPKVFYRGYNVIDPKKVGFVTQGAEAERTGFRYDTSVTGCSNQGHLWGTQLSGSEKDALVEYMKTL
jgi:Cytochrome c